MRLTNRIVLTACIVLAACAVGNQPPSGSIVASPAAVKYLDGKVFAGWYGPYWKIITFHVTERGAVTIDTCDGRDIPAFAGTQTCLPGMDHYAGTQIPAYVTSAGQLYLASEKLSAEVVDPDHIVGRYRGAYDVSLTTLGGALRP